MASEQHDTVFPEEDMDDDDEESQEDEEEEDIMDDDEEENDPSPSTSSAALAVTVAVPSSALPNGDNNAPIPSASTATVVVAAAAEGGCSDPKRPQIEEKKPLDDSRRLFQRLWTDEDEIELLQGFLDYTSQRGSSHHNDTALFYDQIKSKLQLDFNKNQLVEKIRRLKKKYRNVLTKIGSGKEFSFKSPHDQATFEISRKIWSNMGQIADNSLDDDEINLNPNPNPNFNANFALCTPRTDPAALLFGNSAEKKTTPSRKRSRPRSAVRTDHQHEPNEGGSASQKDHHNFVINNAATTGTGTGGGAGAGAGAGANTHSNNNNDCNSGYSIPGLVEETVRSCLSPLVKELVGGVGMGGAFAFGGRGFGGLGLNPMMMMPFGLGVTNLGGGGGEVVDEKWRKQQILELEVYSKRLELVQDQIKAALDDLRSTGGP